MPIKIKINEEANESYDDYILYEILCDYCDEEYVIKYKIKDESPKQAIECCPFCSNLIEEPEEAFHDDNEDSWG